MSRSAAVRVILAAATILTAAACASPTAPTTSAQRTATQRLNDGNTFQDSTNTGCFSGFSVGNSGC